MQGRARSGMTKACRHAASCSTTSRSASATKRSRDFYLQALAPLGFDETNTSDVPPSEIEFGSAEKMDFAISTDYDVGAPIHVAFAADTIEQVHAFHAAALAAGGATRVLPAHDRTTARATTARSCSTTGTTSRLFSTAERHAETGKHVAQCPALDRTVGRVVELPAPMESACESHATLRKLCR